jgi:Inositol-pentakisphosphate 2-kinase
MDEGTSRKKPPLLRSSDWTYVGEGGKHAVFAYLPRTVATADECPDFDSMVGRLLRVDKAVFRQCTDTSDKNECTKHEYQSFIQQFRHDSFRTMLDSILQPYVDVPNVVVLDCAFVRSLRDSALTSGNVPHRRRCDWLTTKEIGQNSNGDCFFVGSVLQDYRISNHPSKVSFCIEIKPKGGYTAISPFVKETRIHKFLKSRYVLLQELYSMGKVTKDWMRDSGSGTIFDSSSYDPLDLFSGNDARVRRALHCLLQCPQNNIKIWAGIKIMLGVETTQSQEGESSFDWHSLGESLGLRMLTNDSKRDVTSFLIDLTAKVLLEESFLCRILDLQKLDVLDADGAIEVYRRLVKLCEDDQGKAESLLDSFPEWSGEGYKSHLVCSVLRNCPLAPKETSNLAKLCNEVEEMERLLEKSHKSLSSLRQLKNFRMQALKVLDTLSIDECRYLLQVWLLSLTMCDLTFFINFTLETTNTWTDPGRDDRCISIQELRILSLQSPGTPGRISFRSCNDDFTHEMLLVYNLKAIDVDRKPALKLRSRHLKEAQFDMTPSKVD